MGDLLFHVDSGLAGTPVLSAPRQTLEYVGIPIHLAQLPEGLCVDSRFRAHEDGVHAVALGAGGYAAGPFPAYTWMELGPLEDPGHF